MERLSSSTLQAIALWSQVAVWVLPILAVGFGVLLYFSKAEITTRKEVADSPRTIAPGQETKIRDFVGKNLVGASVFIESIGDQEADAFAAKLIAVVRSLGANVTPQKNLRTPPPTGILFRFATANLSGTVLLNALREGGIEDVTKGDQVITDENIYIRIGIRSHS